MSESQDPALLAPPIHPPRPDQADAVRQFQGIPGLERSPRGRLWATWYTGGDNEGPDNYVLLVTSADGGESWSEPLLAIDPPGRVRAYDPCLWLDPTGRLWLFWAQSYSWFDGRAGIWAITCDQPDHAAPTWSAPRRLTDGVMMNKPTVLSTGEWLLPAAVWLFRPDMLCDQSFYREPDQPRASRVVASTDQGATWTVRGWADVPEREWDEHMVVERRDGSLWMLVRTFYGIGESCSTDRGVTWSPGAPSSIPHAGSRFFIRRLASGKLLLVRHNSADRARSHLTAFLSDDDGATWGGSLLLDARHGVSYPDGLEAPDGTIHMIYDYDRQGAKQILMATFTAADIAAGQAVSAKAAFQLVVNEATG